jgi:hypothetical protein
MDAARNALDSLLGMAVNFGLDDHKPQEKVGVIFGSEIIGNELHINGVIYAADFPEVAEQIQANKDKLGFSFEARELYTNDANADPLNIVGLSFTGAAILLKNAAAYKTTSIFASQNKETSEMSFFNRMSAAERTKLADTINAANEHMTVDERRDLVDKLTVALAGDLKAKNAADKKHGMLSRIYACENDVRNGGKAELENANNALRNAGVGATVQELAFKSVFEVDAIFAAATRKFESRDRLAVKRVMDRRLGWGR